MYLVSLPLPLAGQRPGWGQSSTYMSSLAAPSPRSSRPRPHPPSTRIAPPLRPHAQRVLLIHSSDHARAACRHLRTRCSNSGGRPTRRLLQARSRRHQAPHLPLGLLHRRVRRGRLRSSRQCRPMRHHRQPSISKLCSRGLLTHRPLFSSSRRHPTHLRL